MKKPCWPCAAALAAWSAVSIERVASDAPNSICSNVTGSAGVNPGLQMVSQNARNRGTRMDGSFPAMMAVLSAPIEMPATQLSGMRASCSPSSTPA